MQEEIKQPQIQDKDTAGSGNDSDVKQNSQADDNNQVVGTEVRPVLENLKVNKKGFIEVDGEIVETLPSITFKVLLENGQEVTARLSGKMRMYKIMLLPGDKVKMEISPYDLTKGRITYRY